MPGVQHLTWHWIVAAQVNICNKLLGAYTIEYVTECLHFPHVPQ